EIVLRLRPGGDAVDYPVDQLPDAGLPPRRPDVAAEVLAHDDVGRELAPELRDLDVLLLEDELARLVADGRRPRLPADLVVGVGPWARPAPLEGEALGLVALAVGPVEAGAPRAGQRAVALCRLLLSGLVRRGGRLGDRSGHLSSVLHHLPRPSSR